MDCFYGCIYLGVECLEIFIRYIYDKYLYDEDKNLCFFYCVFMYFFGIVWYKWIWYFIFIILGYGRLR